MKKVVEIVDCGKKQYNLLLTEDQLKLLHYLREKEVSFFDWRTEIRIFDKDKCWIEI